MHVLASSAVWWLTIRNPSTWTMKSCLSIDHKEINSLWCEDDWSRKCVEESASIVIIFDYFSGRMEIRANCMPIRCSDGVFVDRARPSKAVRLSHSYYGFKCFSDLIHHSASHRSPSEPTHQIQLIYRNEKNSFTPRSSSWFSVKNFSFIYWWLFCLDSDWFSLLRGCLTHSRPHPYRCDAIKKWINFSVHLMTAAGQ